MDGSGAHGAYGGPIFLKVPLEDLGGGDKVYLQ